MEWGILILNSLGSTEIQLWFNQWQTGVSFANHHHSVLLAIAGADLLREKVASITEPKGGAFGSWFNRDSDFREGS